MPLNAGISDEHMKKWLPKIDLSKMVNEPEKLSRSEIIKRLKETKELYDEGILTNEEYEKETLKLKEMLIGN